MVNVVAVPTHPFAVGVTVISAEIGSDVMFAVIKEGIFPVPLPPNPIAGLLFTQLKTVPGTGPETEITGVVRPVQKGISARAFTVGKGYEVIVPDCDAWPHGPIVVRVKRKVPATVGIPLMVNTPAAKFPVTPAGSAPDEIIAPVPLPPIL